MLVTMLVTCAAALMASELPLAAFMRSCSVGGGPVALRLCWEGTEKTVEFHMVPVVPKTIWSGAVRRSEWCTVR